MSAAFPLLEAGLRVLMIDGGKQAVVPPPSVEFISARLHDPHQWKWMVGEDFYALRMRNAVSPKLRVPSHAYAFDDFKGINKIEGQGFVAVGSLATGGLSNTWGCGVARFSASELATFPFPPADLEPSYARVSKRTGISGSIDDDLSEYFGLDAYAQPPISLDPLHTYLAQGYPKHRRRLTSQGFRLGRSRVAVLSEATTGRDACNLSGNCLWGCQRGSMYTSTGDIPALRKHETFIELPGFVIDQLTFDSDCWNLQAQSESTRESRSVTAPKIILAAGTLATTRIVLKTLSYRHSRRLLSCPTAAFLLWLPRRLGAPRVPGFGLGQLSFALTLKDFTGIFGSTFTTTNIPLYEFVRHVPLRRRYGIDLMSKFLSSCVVGNLFLPGQLTEAEVGLREDGSLIVTGRYVETVTPLMLEAAKKLRAAFWDLGAILLPGSFTVAPPGSDIHYAGTLPMRASPGPGETSWRGEVAGLDGVFVVDGACLPALPEKSHTLTIMANADRIARLVINSSK